MSRALAIIEAESPKKTFRHLERSIEREMLFGEVPEGAVYFDPFPNGVTGTIEKKLSGWDRLGGYGYANWIGLINSKGQREPLEPYRINKDRGCRCFPVPKARFAEGENPKRFFHLNQERRLCLKTWYLSHFLRKRDSFALMRPFKCDPVTGLNGRFWAYRFEGQEFSKTEFSCVLTANHGQRQLYRTMFVLYPLLEVQREAVVIMQTCIDAIEREAAEIPPVRAGDQESAKEWLVASVGRIMKEGRQRWEAIEKKHDNLWAF